MSRAKNDALEAARNKACRAAAIKTVKINDKIDELKTNKLHR
jgi:hypothetical protein